MQNVISGLIAIGVHNLDSRLVWHRLTSFFGTFLSIELNKVTRKAKFLASRETTVLKISSD